MEGLRISELAGRAGLAASTVRFYERAGLLSPARRAANGYRVFDESALEELAFIRRAKGIGMSLDDIAGLITAWSAGECRPLQARLRGFLAGQLGQIHQQQAELGTYERQLRAVLDRLAARSDGPQRCGKGCGCETGLEAAADGAGHGSGPAGCSLEPEAMASRLSQWHAVTAARRRCSGPAAPSC